MAEMSDRMNTYLMVTGDREWYEGHVDRRDHDVIAAYLRGLVAGFVAYAWWKDGVQWVGSTGTKLSTAVEFVHEEAQRLEQMEIDAEPASATDERT